MAQRRAVIRRLWPCPYCRAIAPRSPNNAERLLSHRGPCGLMCDGGMTDRIPVPPEGLHTGADCHGCALTRDFFADPGRHGASPSQKRAFNPLLLAVAERDKWTCMLCGGGVDPKHRRMQNGRLHPMAATLDHIRPKSRGGSSKIHNLQLAHYACNQRRGNRFLPDVATG